MLSAVCCVKALCFLKKLKNINHPPLLMSLWKYYIILLFLLAIAQPVLCLCRKKKEAVRGRCHAVRTRGYRPATGQGRGRAKAAAQQRSSAARAAPRAQREAKQRALRKIFGISMPFARFLVVCLRSEISLSPRRLARFARPNAPTPAVDRPPVAVAVEGALCAQHRLSGGRACRARAHTATGLPTW
jgi:hypothetical protein